MPNMHQDKARFLELIERCRLNETVTTSEALFLMVYADQMRYVLVLSPANWLALRKTCYAASRTAEEAARV